MKRTIFALFFITFTQFAFSQSNFHKISLGAGFGATQSFTEVSKHDFGLAAYGTLDYLFTPFISVGLEVQKGEINGGDYKTDTFNREFVNSYQSYSINAKIFLGQFLSDKFNGPSNLLKGIYFGAGLGSIKNATLFSTGLNPQDRSKPMIAAHSSDDFYIPLNLGFNIFLADHEGFYRYVINFNYQGNFTLADNLDGYNDKTSSAIKDLDIYTFCSLGLKYRFGKIGLSAKNLRKY